MNAKLSVFYFCRSDHIFFYYIICMTVPLRLPYYLFPEKLALHCITANLPPQNIKFLQQGFFEGWGIQNSPGEIPFSSCVLIKSMTQVWKCHLATISFEISRQALKELVMTSSCFFKEDWPSKILRMFLNLLRKFAAGWSNTWSNIYTALSFICISLAVIIDRNFDLIK